MAKARATVGDMKKMGLIEVNGIFVKASSQVAKGKVEKINIVFDSLPTLTPEQVMNAYKESGIMYAKTQIGDTFLLPNGEYVDVKYRFIIDPISAPRMTQSDKWKTDPNHSDPKKRQRQPVTNYFRFKNRLVSLCEMSGYKLTKTLNIIFVVPFPKSYSIKKMAELDGKPHDQKPDIDNQIKAFLDCLAKDDRQVWNVHAIKLWGYEGTIIIF